jgi:hypothetical protein
VSCFNVLRARTHFRRYRGRPILFSCFAHPDSFSAISRVSLPFPCFPLPDMFSTVSRASLPVSMFFATGHVFGGIEGLRYLFHVLRSRTHLRRYRGRRVPFSCCAFLDSFSALPRASGPVFTFCAPGLIVDDTATSVPVFVFCAPGLVFGGTEGVGSRFHVLRSRTHFRQYRGRRFPFSCLVLSDSFSADMCTKAGPSICQILQDPLWWMALCLPLKGRRKKYKRKSQDQTL